MNCGKLSPCKPSKALSPRTPRPIDTASTYLSFFLNELVSLGLSVLMLRSGVFGRVNALFGIIGFALMMVFETISSFLPGTNLNAPSLFLSSIGGLCLMVWYFLTIESY